MKIEILEERNNTSNNSKIVKTLKVRVNDIEINDIKVVDGNKGLFVSMPSREYTNKNNEKKYYDIVHLNEEQKQELDRLILNGQAPQQSTTVYSSKLVDDKTFADFGETVELSEDDIQF